jgi:hypothetical protein
VSCLCIDDSKRRKRKKEGAGASEREREEDQNKTTRRQKSDKGVVEVKTRVRACTPNHKKETNKTTLMADWLGFGLWFVGGRRGLTTRRSSN